MATQEQGRGKVKFGLKNVHVAPATEGEEGYTYGVPTRLKGAVSMSLSPVGDTTSFYADDEEYYTSIANNGYDGTLEVAMLPDDFKAEYLGETADAKNVQFENSDGQSKAFALLWEFATDKKAVRHVAYYCKASRPNIEGNTKGQSVEVKSETLNLTIRALPGTGKIKASTRSDVDQTIYDNWYKTVYQETEETPEV